ncbi:MAG: helix-turn-helix transcriptional regulator [Lachnospiraceae bacterium]|nr:helix-turn-helix transcriptional regulator [Lachnospiraceae bacterium]
MNHQSRFFSNPFQTSYYYLALFSCLLVSIVFFYINHTELNIQKNADSKDKMQLIINDFENNLNLFEEAAIKISLNKNFNPDYLSENKFRDTVLLEDFKSYHEVSPIHSELFLYYSEFDSLYRSIGFTSEVDIFTNQFSEEEKQHLLNILHSQITTRQCLYLSDKLLVLLPVKLYSNSNDGYVILGAIIPKTNLINRFRLVSGGMDGQLAFYYMDQLLFANPPTSSIAESKKILSHGTTDGDFYITYLPDYTVFYRNNLFLYMAMILLIWGIVMVFATFFAHKTHNTLLAIPNKYRNKIFSSEEKSSQNTLIEIQNMIEQLLMNNAEIQLQVQNKQAILQKQIIYNLLHGEISSDMPAFMEKSHFIFPGPCYYAGCISFHSDTKLSDDYYSKIATDLTSLTNKETNEYIYAIYDSKLLLVNFIGSSTEEQKKYITDYILEIAESYGHSATTSIGPSCSSLYEIHFSWLKSNDMIHKNMSQSASGNSTSSESSYNRHVQSILTALTEGDGESVLEKFECLINSFDEKNSSFLFLQSMYIYFANELINYTKVHHIELNHHEINSVVTAKNLESFTSAAKKILKHCLEQKNSIMDKEKASMTLQILSYINNHLTDYDLSIEKVAADTNSNPAIIRSVINQESGMLYRDYIVHRRLEYAKNLLLKTNLTVSEICDKVGYANVSYFVRIFRENVGVTPSKFRQTYKDMN